MSKLSVNELQQGMNLGEPVFAPVGEKLLLKIGTRLTNHMIQNLKASGVQQVEILNRYTLVVNPEEKMAITLEDYLVKGILRVAPNYLEANKSDEMRAVSALSIKIARDLAKVEKIQEFCVQMQIIDNKNLLHHSINTCILSILTAGAMGLSKEEIYQIGAAALLHDVGMCEMPFLINKKDMVSQEELLWKEHPTYGYYFAMQNDISREIAEIILSHEERFDGSGFPKKLSGENIPIGARIINVCGEYDNLITVQNIEPYQAIEYMYCGSGCLYDKKVVDAFTQNISVYPLGAFVRLTTKETGIVVNIRENQGPRPIVRVYFNRVNKPLSTPKIVDLGIEKTIFIEQILDQLF